MDADEKTVKATNLIDVWLCSCNVVDHRLDDVWDLCVGELGGAGIIDISNIINVSSLSDSLDSHTLIPLIRQREKEQKRKRENGDSLRARKRSGV